MLKRKGFSPAFLLVLASALVVCSLACAANAAQAPIANPTPSQTLADTLQQSVFPVLGSIVLGLFSWLCTKIGTTFKISSLTNENNLLMQIAAQGVAYVEERAAALVGSKAEITSSQKLDMAIAYICQALPKVTADEAQRAATTVLAMIPGIGATGASSFTVAGGAPAASLNITAATAPIAVAPAVVAGS